MWVRRSNLEGVILDAVVEHVEPTTMLTLEGKDSTRVLRVTGSHADLFRQLQSVMRFNVTLAVAEDRAWGTMKEDGSWSGNYIPIFDKQDWINQY